MPLYLRDTNYSGGTNLGTTLTYGQLDGNFIFLDGKFSTGPFTGSLQGTASRAISASWAPGASPLSTTGSSIYSTNPATSLVNSGYGIYMGFQAGYQATDAQYSNFLGYRAGYQATNAGQSNFLGYGTGESTIDTSNSNFIGWRAGYQATNAASSNFFGYSSGYQANQANNANFFGFSAGYQAYTASYSNFIGAESGYSAAAANNSTFIGTQTGYGAVSASYSMLIGYRAGYNAAGGVLGIKSNNIIIGTNITLENGRKDSINIGGLIFGTGSYSTTTGNPSSGSANGKVGINQPVPQYNLDLSGSFRQNNGHIILTQVSQSLNFADDTAAAAGGVPLGGLYRNGNVVSIRIS